MFVMCFSTAPGVTTRLSAIAVFERPSAISSNTERSRAVSELSAFSGPWWGASSSVTTCRSSTVPPTFSDEGLRAAIEARRRQPGLGVLVLSQYVETAYASELIGEDSAGIGYLLKERVGDVRAFLDALRRVAAGGTVLDRQVVAELLATRDGPTTALSGLTTREREVLALMAEGRSNAAIAESLVVTAGAVEKHITNILSLIHISEP